MSYNHSEPSASSDDDPDSVSQSDVEESTSTSMISDRVVSIVPSELLDSSDSGLSIVSLSEWSVSSGHEESGSGRSDAAVTIRSRDGTRGV